MSRQGHIGRDDEGMLMLALNLMIEFGKVGTDQEYRKGLMGRGDPVESEFIKIYLSYLSQ